MPAYLVWYDDTDTTVQSAEIPAGPVDGGTTYTLPNLHAWNDKGAAFGDTVTASGILIYAAASISGNEYLSGAEAGVAIPILDQQWIGVQITGVDKTGDSTMEDQTTPVFRIGAGAFLIVKDIPKNCARYVQFTVNVPPGASNQPFTVNLYVTVGNAARVLPVLLGTVSGGGVLPDWMDASARRMTRGGVLSATGIADIGIANRSWVADGTPHTATKDTETLNQTASDGALGVGQKYEARISQPVAGGGVTVTKGVKGAAPAVPALPANEIDLGYVDVLYDVGGTSVIVTANLNMTGVLYGEYLVTDGGGLNARVGAGVAIASSDSGPFVAQSILVALADTATNTVWLKPDGSKIANTTDAIPVAGAQRLAFVVTVGGVITTITDARTFVGHAVYDYVIQLRKTGTFNATATDIAWDVVPFDAAIVETALEIGKKGTAASGSFIANITTRPAGTDLGTAGTTIFTNSGTDDFRPTVAFNATVLRAESVGHEVTTVTKGMRIAADIAAVPGTITVDPQDFYGYVYLRRLQ